MSEYKLIKDKIDHFESALVERITDGQHMTAFDYAIFSEVDPQSNMIVRCRWQDSATNKTVEEPFPVGELRLVR